MSDEEWGDEVAIITLSGHVDDYRKMLRELRDQYGCELFDLRLDSVTEIGAWAFYGCISLGSITIPNTVKKIGEGAFDGCTSLFSISIPDSVERIDDLAFYGCTSLESITIPKSVTKIGFKAFYGCTSLKSITIMNPNLSDETIESIREVTGADIEYICTNPVKAISHDDSKPVPNRDISKSKFKPENSPGIRFSDIAGLDEAKERIYESVILPIKRPDLYEAMRIKKGDGIILYGPPGTGKTMFAQALATEIKAAFFSVKLSDIESRGVGETETNIRELFETARAFDTSVIFFDEFESLGMSRNIGFNQDIYGRTVAELLAQMQGFSTSQATIILLAATNRPWDIDSALKRPGRFGCQIYVGLPDLESRRYMLKKQFEGIDLAEDVNLDSIAHKTEGFNGADMAELCNRIKMNSIRRNVTNPRSVVSNADVQGALEKVRPSVLPSELKKYEDYT